MGKMGQNTVSYRPLNISCPPCAVGRCGYVLWTKFDSLLSLSSEANNLSNSPTKFRMRKWWGLVIWAATCASPRACGPQPAWSRRHLQTDCYGCSAWRRPHEKFEPGSGQPKWSTQVESKVYGAVRNLTQQHTRVCVTTYEESGAIFMRTCCGLMLCERL